MADSTKAIHLYNSLSGKRELFTTLKPGEVTLYSCGPTVYGFTHVGNARAALVADLVVRVLTFSGLKVTFARNITDIDDKIIKVSQTENTPWPQIVEKFTEAYHSDLSKLGISKPSHEPRATQTLKEITLTIEQLIKEDAAYTAETPYGTDVYFRVSKFSTYGKLSKRKIEDLKTGVRIEPGESKEDPLDFALWKAAKPGEPSWNSPWGEGRPGWHIECSAMIESLFHGTIDIHMGGIDLIFPHHENEIAQSETCFHRPLANYWVHNGLLNFGKEKMSKSLGNIFTTQKFLELYGAEVFKLMCLQHHYRGPMEFSDEVILRAEALLERIYHAFSQLEKAKNSSTRVTSAQALEKLGVEFGNLKEQIEAPLFDDFNTAKGLGVLLKTIRALNKLNDEPAWMALELAQPVLVNVFGLLNESPESGLRSIRQRKLKRLGITESRALEIEELLKNRDLARKNKDFATSDKLRADIESQGIVIMDSPEGSAWTIREK
jgi:cysteinyl-tRNA synthetase